MSKRPKPLQVGTCPCPSCGAELAVFKYRERSDRWSMFKGKFYATCPKDGRVIDAGIPASQEHVLEKGTIWGANRPEPGPAMPAQMPAPEPEQTPAVPAPPERPEPPRTLGDRLRGWNLWDWWPTRRTPADS